MKLTYLISLAVGAGLAVTTSVQAKITSFDACAYTNTPASRQLLYGAYNLSTAEIQSANDCTSEPGYTNTLVVFYSENENVDISVQTGNGVTSPNGSYFEPSILVGAYYNCGEYDGSANDSLGNPTSVAVSSWLNDYLDGIDDGYQIDEHHTATSYSATIIDTNGSCATTTWYLSKQLLDPYLPSSDVKHGDDHGTNNGCYNGMPHWLMTEPYLNLWVKDTPVFYTTSLGQKIGFDIAYKQHDTRPAAFATSVPPRLEP